MPRPRSSLRSRCLWTLVALVLRLIYRLRIAGAERVPADGGVLVCCSHQSLVDGGVLGVALPRPATYITYQRYVDIPVLGTLLRWCGCVPVDEKGSRRALAATIATATEAAAAGGAVCIFPEGKLTRSGQTDRFQAGCERIAERAGVPILPAAIDGLWGAGLGLSHDPRARWRLRWRPRVDLRFGAPLPSTATAGQVRARCVALLHDIARERAADQRDTLIAAALRGLRRRSFAPVVRDAKGALGGLALAGLAAALRRRLRLDEGETAVGIVLPPGRGGAIANLCVAMAGRTAVNLNHTAGETQLRRMLELAGVRTIISSRLYRTRIRLPDLPARVIDLEDVLPGVGKAEILARGAAALLGPAPAADPDAVAALVFTSGSTGDPKGVELTHRQILANVHAIAEAFAVAEDDCLATPLPLFHSFGLVPGLWMPLCHRVCVAGQADPSDGAALGALLAEAKATILVGTATFARSWMRRIEPAQAARLRMTIVGAEKCPADLRAAWSARYGSPLLEGYGCTELCPVVSVNLPAITRGGLTDDRARDGSVGRPLPGIHVAAVDIATGAELPPGEEGMLVVWSPARMRGYLGRPDLTAKVLLRDGYITGDRGRVDDDGFIAITGRISRFAKIGGEMVPLDLVQEAVLSALAAAGHGESGECAVAAASDPGRGERLVVLHTGIDADWAGLFDRLDLAPLWRPRAKDVRQVEALPKLGTGKLDLAALARLAAG